MKCKLGVCTWLEDDEKDVCCFDCHKVNECFHCDDFDCYEFSEDCEYCIGDDDYED